MENRISLVLVLLAGASLVSMLATLRIDSIVHQTLYNYGLQFSTQWAIPYWTMATIVFSMGWFIILTSVAFELHLIMHRRHKLPKPEIQCGQRAQEPIQNDMSGMETNPSGKSEEEAVKTTALAVKTEDELSEFRVLLEEIHEMTNVSVTRQKADNKPINGK